MLPFRLLFIKVPDRKSRRTALVMRVCVFSFRRRQWKECCHLGQAGLPCCLNAGPFRVALEKETVGAGCCTLPYKFSWPTLPHTGLISSRKSTRITAWQMTLFGAVRFLSQILEQRSCSLKASGSPERPPFFSWGWLLPWCVWLDLAGDASTSENACWAGAGAPGQGP